MKKSQIAIYAYSAAYNPEQIKIQIAACKDLATKKGFSLAGVYEDAGDDRTNRMYLLEDAKAGKFQKVVVLRLDRFSRNTLEMQTIIQQLQDAGISIETVLPSDALFEQMLANLRRPSL